MEQFGVSAGLGAAACWAVASIFFTRVPLGAGAMTTFKNCLAAACMFVALLVASVFTREPIIQASWQAIWDVSVSGVIGLCLADIAYFRSIQILGARRGVTLTLLTPPTTAVLGHFWLRDYLTLTTGICILVTIAGIAAVMRERVEPTADQRIRPGSTRWGVTCALLGIAMMAVGAVLLKRGTSEVGAIEATFIRLFAASLFGVLMSWPLGDFSEMKTLLANRVGTRDLCFATLLGTVIGVYFMLVAYKYCSTGIAATLTSTTPLFVIPVAYFTYKQAITWPAILGALVAFGGVCGLIATN